MTRTAVFASGRGSNFSAIYQKIEEGYLKCQLSALISDNAKAGALEFARRHRIPTFVVAPKEFPTREAFGERLLGILTDQQIEYIFLAGYLKMIPENVVERFENRILNIHPALLPAFGGKGMYGMHVHQAIFDSGAQISGVTVHFVSKEYDAGAILLQKAVDIRHCQSPQEIADKVLAVEHKTYAEAIKILLEGKFHLKGKRVFFND